MAKFADVRKLRPESGISLGLGATSDDWTVSLLKWVEQLLQRDWAAWVLGMLRTVLLFLSPLIAGALWLIFTFFVAYPTELSRWDIEAVGTKFLSDSNRVFFWLLIAVDLFIVIAILRDRGVERRFYGWRLSIMVLCVAVFAVVTGVLPERNPHLMQWSYWLFVIGVLCIWVVRVQSYAAYGTHHKYGNV